MPGTEKEKGKQTGFPIEDEIKELFGESPEEAASEEEEFYGAFGETGSEEEEVEEEAASAEEEEEAEAEGEVEEEEAPTGDVEEEEPEEEPAEEEPEVEEEPDDRAALIEKLNELSVKKLQEQDPITVAPPDLTELLENVDVDEVVDTTEKFKEFLGKFATTVQQQAITGVLRSIPEIITKHTQRQQALTKIRDDFYVNHPELEPVKQYVAYATTEVASQNPDWAIQDVLEEAAKRAYKTLGIKKATAEGKKKKTKTKPAFVSKPAQSRKSKSKVSPLQKELDELFDD